MLYDPGHFDRPYDEWVMRVRAERARVITKGLAAALRALARGARSVHAGWAEARRRSAAIRELRALDDDMLADIGIRRDQIRMVVESGRPADRSPTVRRALRVIAETDMKPHVMEGDRRKAA